MLHTHTLILTICTYQTVAVSQYIFIKKAPYLQFKDVFRVSTNSLNITFIKNISSLGFNWEAYAFETLEENMYLSSHDDLGSEIHSVGKDFLLAWNWIRSRPAELKEMRQLSSTHGTQRGREKTGWRWAGGRGTSTFSWAEHWLGEGSLQSLPGHEPSDPQCMVVTFIKQCKQPPDASTHYCAL